MTPEAMHNLSGDDCKYYIPAATILACTSASSSSLVQHALVSFYHKQIMAPCPSPPAEQVPTRVNPLAFGVCGTYVVATADELEYI